MHDAVVFYNKYTKLFEMRTNAVHLDFVSVSLQH